MQLRSGKKRGRREAFNSAYKSGLRKDDTARIPTSNFNTTSSVEETAPPDSIPVFCANNDASESSLVARHEELPDSESLEVNKPLHDKRVPSFAKDSEPSTIRFNAVDNDGNLIDIRAYHRGREGAEIRDKQTGELLFDGKIATDSNYGIDTEPKALHALVTIQFPIDDDNASTKDYNESSKKFTDESRATPRFNNRGNNNKGNCAMSDRKASCRYFSETIRWNLADVNCPTPMAYAAGVAQEFGLSYVQTSDLAESIQNQLQKFIQDNCTHTAPVALRGILSSSPSQHTLDFRPSQMVPTLYGEVTGSLEIGGICRPVAQKSKQQKFIRSVSTISNKSTTSKTSEKDNDRSNKQNPSANSRSKIPAKRKISRPIDKPTKTTKATKPEQIHYWQVRARLLAASQKDIMERGTSDIVFYEDYVCHICREERPLCGVFACCMLSHAYCENHLIEKLQLTMHPNQTHPLSLEYCPVCSLSCDCPECSTKLDSATMILKRACHVQKLGPERVVVENLFDQCKLMQVDFKPITGAKKREIGNISSSKTDRRRSEASLNKPHRVVPKVPRIEFPREVADGVDLDHGYEIDYSTIFTARGPFIANPHPISSTEMPHFEPSNSHSTPEKDEILLSPIEDGNVDYCNICRKVGNLLCCDYCPRAFHNACMSAEDRSTNSEDKEKWQCPICHHENEVLPEDSVSGESSQTAVCAAYSGLGSEWSSRDLAGLKLLSVLHEMLLRLMDYDFGYMFRVPVDVKQIPLYTTIVKKPMDLGTISSNIMKGVYAERIQVKENAFDDIALAVLKDVELVWHNCFLFNADGSAVYRMAEVQRNRASAIRKISFEHLLSVYVKEEFLKFANACEKERGSQRSIKSGDGPPRKSTSTGRLKAKHKIMGTSPFRGGKGRPVAILDSETGRIVKIYATMQSASNVVNFFLDMNFECELMRDQISSLNKLRAFVLQSKSDRKCRLFGYRWLLLEDLRGGRVTFPTSTTAKKAKKPKQDTSYSGEDEDVAAMCCLIEMVDGDRTYIFNSIEESLSFPGIEADLVTLREQLVSLSPGFDFTDAAGRRWKRLDEPSIPISQLPHGHVTRTRDPASAIIKVDLISDATLMGFRTVDAAFHDWLSTLDASVFEIKDRCIETFRTHYLDGNRNIDGICWRTGSAAQDDNVGRDELNTSAKDTEETEETKETKGRDAVDHAHSSEKVVSSKSEDVVLINGTSDKLNDSLFLDKLHNDNNHDNGRNSL